MGFLMCMGFVIASAIQRQESDVSNFASRRVLEDGGGAKGKGLQTNGGLRAVNSCSHFCKTDGALKLYLSNVYFPLSQLGATLLVELMFGDGDAVDSINLRTAVSYGLQIPLFLQFVPDQLRVFGFHLPFSPLSWWILRFYEIYVIALSLVGVTRSSGDKIWDKVRSYVVASWMQTQEPTHTPVIEEEEKKTEKTDMDIGRSLSWICLLLTFPFILRVFFLAWEMANPPFA